MTLVSMQHSHTMVAKRWDDVSCRKHSRRQRRIIMTMVTMASRTSRRTMRRKMRMRIRSKRRINRWLLQPVG